MMKKFLALTFLLGVLFLITNGLSDILIVLRQEVQGAFTFGNAVSQIPETQDADAFEETFIDTHKLKYSTVRPVGLLPQPGDYGSYQIGQNGERLFETATSISPQKEEGKRVLILGSSQTFGYLNNSTEQFSAQLAQLLPEYRFRNFSVPSQLTIETLAHWQRLVRLGYEFDRVLVFAGQYDVFDYCQSFNEVGHLSKNRFALMHVVSKLSEILMGFQGDVEGDKRAACDDPKVRHIIAENIMSNFKSMIAYGESRNQPTQVFLIPSPYMAQPNLDNLIHSPDYAEFRKEMRLASEEMVAKTSGAAHVFDLTNIFNDSSPMFLDWGGHFSTLGNKTVAKAVADILQVQQ